MDGGVVMEVKAKGYSPEELAALRELAMLALDYDPSTGIFVWKYRQGDFPGMTDRGRKMFNSRFAGTEAGSIKYDGYLSVRLAGKLHRAHRLAWLITHGDLPDVLDHINQDRSDNRIINIRLSTFAENSKNAGRQSGNTSGITGVCWFRKPKKWRARIHVNGRNIHLGMFASIEDAKAARNAANIKYGFSPGHGLEPSSQHNQYNRERQRARRAGVQS